MSLFDKLKKDGGTSSIREHGAAASSGGVDAGAGGGAMPRGLDEAVPPGGAAAAPRPVGAPQPEADGEAKPRSALVDAVLGNLAEGPFALMALKTGREHWLLAREERALLSEAAGAIPAKYGVSLTPQENPVACLLLGYLGFAAPRIVEELRLIREEMKKDRERKEAEAAAARRATGGAEATA